MYRKTVIVICALLLGAAAWSQDLEAIKQNMAQRLPVLTQLKKQQVVGETNQGLLAFLPGKPQSKQDVVAAENADRKLIYQAIAARTGTTADLVAKRRAEQIAQQSESGMMLQDATGNWYQKR